MKLRRQIFSGISSTNTYLHELIKRGEGHEDYVVVADYQESGRGQGAHEWYSEPGKNLLISFLLHPAFLSASSAFHISRMASLALCDLLSDLGFQARIKWPNDILLEGKKVAGMLIENGFRGSTMDYTIVGIGLNVWQEHFPEFPRKASSLLLAGRESGMADNLADPISLSYLLEDKILSWYSILSSGDVLRLEQDYLIKLYGIHKEMAFIIKGKKQMARISGVDEWGQLVLEMDGKSRAFNMQEVVFLD